MAGDRPQALDAELLGYLAEHARPEPDEVQQKLIATTQQRTGGASVMQIGNDQAVWFEMLTRAIGARHALEIGTFTGYSALAIARGLAPQGRLICCDVSAEWTSIAQGGA